MKATVDRFARAAVPAMVAGALVFGGAVRAACLFFSCSVNDVLPRGGISNTRQRTFHAEIEFFLGIRGRMM